MKIAIIGSGSQSATLPVHLQALARSGVELMLVQPRLSLFAFTAYERLLVDLGYVDACQQAAAQGADAIVINSFADYGMEAARAAVNVPVYGAGESALRAAAAFGAFGIITVWPSSMSFLYRERLSSLGLTTECLTVRHIHAEDELARLADESGVMQRMARQERSIIETIQAHRDALIEQGARSVVLGCTCMGPIGPALSTGSALPIIEGSVAAVRDAMAYANPSPTETPRTQQPHLIPKLIDAWSAQQSLPDADDCPVCVSTESES
jgi:allantoin racemase